MADGKPMAIRLLGESFRPLWDTRCAIDHIVRLAFAQAERDRRLEARLKRQAHWLGYELVPIDQKPTA